MTADRVTSRRFRFAVQPMSSEVNILQDRDALRTVAHRAVDAGFDELYVPDHFGSIDPFPAVMLAADAAPQLRVGTLVLNNEFHHPALLARTAATIDRLTGGRFVLGCGTGYMASEHDSTGIELRAPKERVDRFEESMRALRSLLDDGTYHHDGTHHRLAIDKLGVVPVQSRVPLLIGGHGKRVVQVAGRYADIFQYTGLSHGPGGAIAASGFALDDLRRRADWIEDAAGDRIRAIERSALVQVFEIGNGQAVTRAAELLGLDEATIAETPFALVGTVEQIIDKIERLRAQLGITHYVVRDVDAFAPIIDALDRD
jgi:probable F420-dependent oxidoreductase